MKIKIQLFLCLLLSLNTAQAWNYSGHMVIAKIARHHLSPEARVEVDRLSHVLDKQYPQMRGFVASAIWADWIRSHDITAFDDWHYINQPLLSSSKELSLNPPPSLNPKNVVWAISQSLKVLRSQQASDFEKALFLRLLVHFVGDIHQPLHCVSFYSGSFPKGDQGGNQFLIISPYGDNLHTAWDKGLGYFKRYTGKDRISHMASAIEKKYPPEKFGQRLTQLKPAPWAKESYLLAKQRVYIIPEKSVLTATYIQDGQELTQEQIALAGYRLAYLLNDIFKEEN